MVSHGDTTTQSVPEGLLRQPEPPPYLGQEGPGEVYQLPRQALQCLYSRDYHRLKCKVLRTQDMQALDKGLSQSGGGATFSPQDIKGLF